MYVTDYTENNLLLDREEPEPGSFPLKERNSGPYGCYVLKVNVKQPHASYAERELFKGDLAYLKNVKIKRVFLSSDSLQADMWPDHLNPERIKIEKILSSDAEPVEQMLFRKQKYWSENDLKKRNLSNDALSALSSKQSVGKPGARGKKKKRKKNAEQVKQIASAAQAQEASGVEDSDNGEKRHKSDTDHEQQSRISTPANSNPYVRCGYSNKAIIRRVHAILCVRSN